MEKKLLENAISIIAKKYGDSALQILTKDFETDIKKVSTGLPSLDYILGGGIPVGRIIEIFGPEAAGKTTLALQIMAQCQKVSPEKKVAYIDLENALDPIYAKKIGVDLSKMYLNQPNCYDEKTEVLAEGGWKFFKDITIKERVCQVSDTGIRQFVRPSKYIKQVYKGDMFSFKDRRNRLDLLVTPEHRMIYKKNGSFQGEVANKIKFLAKKNIITTAKTDNNDSNELTAYERFLIAFQADGSYPSMSRYKSKSDIGKICKHTTTRFNFQKGRKVTRLLDICKKAKLSYKIFNEKSRVGQTTVYVEIPLKQTLSKTFNWVKVKDCSRKWCEAFIDELSYWDGTKRNNRHIKYDTTIEVNADIAQQIALSAGYSVVYTITKMKSKKHNDVHTLNIHLYSREIEGQSVKKTIIKNWSGYVYCVTVPSSMLLVRRNKKVVVCGNSGEEALDIVEKLSQSNSMSCIVVDSVSNLVPQSVAAKEIDGTANIGTTARLLSQNLPRLNNAVSRSGTILVFINQIRMKIGVCFNYDARVNYKKGTKKIGKIVNQQLPILVESWNFNKNKLELKKIDKYYNRGSKGIFYELWVEKNAKNGKSSFGVTDNHNIFTPDGEKKVKDLKVGDFVLQKNSIKLSSLQKHLVVGSLLGDGSIRRNRYFRITQGVKQKEYLKFKGKILEGVNYNIQKYKEKHYSLFSESLYGDIQLLGYKPDFKKKGIIYLSNEFINKLSIPALATWYLDDGTYDNNKRYRASICLKICPKNILKKLAEQIEKLGVAKPRVKSGVGLIWGNKKESFSLFSKIRQYVPKCMDYKVDGQFNCLGDKYWFRGNKAQEKFILLPAKVIKKELKKIRSSNQFDLEIKDNHNYFVDDILVHNSWGNPETTTGGLALKYNATQRIEIRGQKAEERNGKEGIPVKIKIKKNKIAPPFRETEAFLIFGEGFDTLSDLLETAIAKGIIQKSGAWYIYEKLKVHGTDELREEFLKDNKLQNKLLKEIK